MAKKRVKGWAAASSQIPKGEAAGPGLAADSGIIQRLPPRNCSTRRSLERRAKARIVSVVVLSVQFRKTLASHTYKLATSWVLAKRLVTNFVASLPMRHVPVSCRL